jgi:hypothetical protein
VLEGALLAGVVSVVRVVRELTLVGIGPSTLLERATLGRFDAP